METSAERTTVVVLASGSGTLAQAVLDAAAEPDCPFTVAAVVADRECGALDRARRTGVPAELVAPAAYPDRAAWDRALADAVAAHEPRWVASAGFMRLLGPAFLGRFPDRVVNTHPALLPAFPGAHAVADALAAGVSVTGCTVHLVDAGVDTGPVITRRAVEVRPDDTEASLHERIKVHEREMLVDVLGAAARGRLRIQGRKVVLEVADQSRRPVRRALVSVYDKTGLEEFARGLAAAGVEIVSTGSTAARIADAGVAVTAVDELTGFPECLEGRVKTLHPRVHAGILADSRKPEHLEQIADLGVEPFELVVVNLYPFTETVASGADRDACVEQIDIGGPSMVRAAAKNHPSVAVLVDPEGYDDALEAVRAGGFTLEERRQLAAAAFRHTAAYDVAVATWMTEQTAGDDEVFPVWKGQSLELAHTLRYGENPHQSAALYTDAAAAPGLAQARQVHGKEMSYNNYTDGDAAWRAAHDHAEPCVAIIKHANPCGIAIAADIATAHRAAHECDPVSAFGGVIAANREVSVEMAEQVAEIFTEVVIAPSYADGAVEILQRKKNIRILTAEPPVAGLAEHKQITGGVLVQSRDDLDAPGDVRTGWERACGPELDDATLRDLQFAWRACRAVKSNAILLAHQGATVGVGMGQVNRVDSARLAVQRAGDRVVGSVAASDAFFPFADGLEVLAEAGVRAVVQPGGSVRDSEVVEAAEKAGITMYLTGARHFFH